MKPDSPLPPQPPMPPPPSPAPEPQPPHPQSSGHTYSQPVAYDQAGNPLYAQPQFVHMARSVQPIQEELPQYIIERHAASQKKYPYLNLSRGEYIISAVKRHPIGLLRIWFIGLALVGAFMALYVLLFSNGSDGVTGVEDMQTLILGGLAFLIVLIVAGTFVATYVYNANRFYLTNESVIQEIQTSIFSKHEQTVSLSNIEDASYKQGGIFPMLFNYGTIRLSTEGDETTYRFSYVANPKKHIAVLNNAVEAFKNGRPVDPPHDDQPS